jgi:3',5'-cyclic AMP phosphodiesterase CpdA
MFRLAHVTDPHFRSFAGVRLRDFVSKRALGTANLLLNRRKKHRMELLSAMGDEIRAQKPDHLALTGDLANVSLEAEWREALRWIAACGPPEAITVIPGNHDTYVPETVRTRLFERLFEPYQSSDMVWDAPISIVNAAEDGSNDDRRNETRMCLGPETYPFVRLRGEVALVAVNTCVPVLGFGAWGAIGAAQLARLGALLEAPEIDSKVRVVLLHHPPVVHRGGEDRNLRDRAGLADVLARTGAELVLHGHDHRDEEATLAGPGGVPIPVIGLGSASYDGPPDRRSRFNIYEIEMHHITCITYVHDKASNRYQQARSFAVREK